MPETLAGPIRNIVDKLQTNGRTHAVTIGPRVALWSSHRQQNNAAIENVRPPTALKVSQAVRFDD